MPKKEKSQRWALRHSALVTGRVELLFLKTRKDAGGANLGEKSGVKFWDVMFEIFIKHSGRDVQQIVICRSLQFLEKEVYPGIINLGDSYIFIVF